VSELFTPEHLGAVAVTASICALLVMAARREPGTWTDWFSRALALVLVLNEVSWWIVSWRSGLWNVTGYLPLQLCSAATFVAAAALLWRRPFLVELTWFWGVAGTLQAILTPDLVQHFPDYWFVQYYLGHGGIVLAALFLTLGLGLRPRPGAAVRAFLATLAVTAVIGLADLVTGGNYMYLRRPPPGPTLLELMGPWPWYIAGSTLLAAVFFLALEVPFRVGRRTP